MPEKYPYINTHNSTQMELFDKKQLPTNLLDKEISDAKTKIVPRRTMRIRKRCALPVKAAICTEPMSSVVGPFKSTSGS
jgi:hypothetical protein